jgi:hypothetical protein
MSGDIGSYPKEIAHEPKKESIVEENPLENLDFEVLIKKIGFYQR